ncbi:MAG TPA: HsdR family type I site-specific deoxyribonuclease [Candidatus Udaeobacter sp.]|nr:HsdR family type I site-specific deoxyribonuclease [Candidatus Udaeobacter sp.]
MATFATESATVQDPLVRYAGEIGWEIVPQSEAVILRKGEGGMFFYKLLEETLLRLNPGIITLENVDEVIRRLEAVRNSIEGNAEILAWLRAERSVHVASEKRQRQVRLIDYEDVGQNIFQVSPEWEYTNGLSKPNRADVMFLVNGVPVALVETKSARKELEEALVQIRRYHRETPEMLTTPQVFDITHLIEFYYGATWSLDRKNLFSWRDESPGNFEAKVKAFFEPKRFLKMLKEWILFYIKDDELKKTILRQHQTRAVEKVVARCADPQKKRGLVWHTQGSGKTFTMITAARLILELKEIFKTSTVLLIVDRNELEGQLSGWVERLLGELSSRDIKIEYACRKDRLRELLGSDFRGLIISMIHKFDGIPKNINTRDNVYVLIDEAHRSTGGDLGNYLMAALPNATLIGFTGTPIDKTAYGKGTFKVFGKDDKEGYLDKYSIAESINDGTTLKLKYALAPNEIRLPEKLLEEEFLDLAEAEGISDVEDLNRILDKAVKLKAFLKSDARVKAVAEFVAKDFKEKVRPLGYKAFLVAVDREACALYKQALDKLLPPEWTSAIYTPAQNDSERFPLVAKYQLGETEETRQRKTFTKPGLDPQILIVTDKLLTGYDAEILYCMYLDKPMRDHVLLQAIARVNRPYEQEEKFKKPCGFIVDFVGVLGKLKKALAFDSKQVDVSKLIASIDVLLARFKELMRAEGQKYLQLTKGTIDDKAVERAIDAFVNKTEREKFYGFFKEVEALYEILSPSAELADFISDFRNLATLYQTIRNAFGAKTTFYADVAKKTELLIREEAETYGVKQPSKVVEIDEKTLEAIKKSKSSDSNKVVNLVKGLVRAAEENGKAKPYLIPIGARAQEIMEAFEESQDSSAETLKQLEKLAKERIDAEKEREKAGLDADTFTIYWELKREGLGDAAEFAKTIKTLFDRFPNHRFNADELRQLKAEIYKLLLNVVRGKRMVALTEKLLNLVRS